MIGASKAKSPREYIAALPEERRAVVAAIHSALKKAVPGLRPSMQAGMIGYGTYHYTYASGREGDWPILALANQKQYVSVYICAADPEKGYLAEANKHRLGKASVGRSCIRFKRLEDVNLDVLLELARKAARMMGKKATSRA